jgi:nicotinamide riboside kinase
MPEKITPHKIAFVGTSCIGKTALLEVFSQRRAETPTIAIIPEAARDFFLATTVEDRFSADTQGRIQALALQREQEAHSNGADIILCDRSVIDAVVYTEAHGDPEGAVALLERVEFWLPTYNSFLLLDPADIPYQTDDVRTESAAKRQEFHEAFLVFFKKTGIPYQLLSGTIDERVATIEALLNTRPYTSALSVTE